MRGFAAEDIKELYYMVDQSNLQSILENGILSHDRAGKIKGHVDISNHSVQAHREDKYLERAVLGKKPLTVHQHAVLYINPHNAMMYALRGVLSLCVLRISKLVLERSSVVISNRNAAAKEAKFYKPIDFRLSPESSSFLTDLSPFPKEVGIKDIKRRQVRQAEVLIPYKVDPCYITGIIVRSEAHQAEIIKLMKAGRKDLPVDVEPALFFSYGGVYFRGCLPKVLSAIEHPASPASSEDEVLEDERSADLELSIPRIKPTPITLFRTASPGGLREGARGGASTAKMDEAVSVSVSSKSAFASPKAK